MAISRKTWRASIACAGIFAALYGCGGGGGGNGFTGGTTGTTGKTGASIPATQTGSQTVGQAPVDFAINHTSHKMYVADKADNKVTVLNSSTLAISSQITIPTGPNPANAASPIAITIDEAANRVYVCGDSGRDVVVIDGNTDTVLTKWITNNNAQNLVLDTSKSRAYVATYAQGAASIQVFDTGTGANVGTFPVSGSVISFSFRKAQMVRDPVGGKIFFGFNQDTHLMSFDPSTNHIAVTTLATNLYAIRLNPATGDLYVVLSQVDNRTAQTQDAVLFYPHTALPSTRATANSTLKYPPGWQALEFAVVAAFTVQAELAGIAFNPDQNKFYYVGTPIGSTSFKDVNPITNIPAFSGFSQNIISYIGEPDPNPTTLIVMQQPNTLQTYHPTVP
jgi:DNA-binding beta-propeller fold protein YncE